MSKLKFKHWLGIIFVVLGLYAQLNRGDLPAFLSTQVGNVGTLTLLGKVFLVLVFPVSMLGLTVEGKVSEGVFLLLIVLAQFFYGFLIGTLINKLKR